MWLSDPLQEFPQDLILSWSEEQTFNRVALTFDNLVQFRHNNPWESGQRVLQGSVKAYELSVWEKDSEWKTIVWENENHNRFKIHSFEPVCSNKLRLRVLETHGGKNGARVYQIGVYCEKE